MNRIWAVCATFLLAMTLLSLFQVKNQVRNLDKELEETYRQVAREQNDLRVLKAEWSYLNQPERLASLSDKYLKLAPTRVAQVRSLEDGKLLMLARAERTTTRTDGYVRAARSEKSMNATQKPLLTTAQLAVSVRH
ncbi:MAG: putative secreted (periplasmic) protein [Rickettsiales bacterium]|jgi:cell division protein FtsL|nr:putative secreted (periplasmic) protein [Rickettsiales bacterium]